MCVSCRMTRKPPRLGTGKGWYVHSTGYVIGCIAGEKFYQHRHIMEQLLGRKLKRNEHVHHKDGNRSNNNIDNLELLDGSEHHKHHFTNERAKALSLLGHKARWNYLEEKN